MDGRVFRVAVVGGIAVGKSTIIQMLRESIPDSTVIEEDISENIFLPDFYADMTRWAFHSRISTLAMTANNYVKTLDCRHPLVIMDRCIDELITFATLQYNGGRMSEKEFLTYRLLYDCLVKMEHPIDLFFYCKCSVRCSLERIRERNRSIEQHITGDYLERLNDQYERWILSLDPSRVVEINTERQRHEIRSEVIRKLNEKYLS